MIPEEGRERLGCVGEKDLLDEADATGGAFDISDDCLDHGIVRAFRNELNNGVKLPAGDEPRRLQVDQARRLKRLAISLPVKLATQPSGLLNRRMATKRGWEPMSNQCGVLAGTLMRSPLVQRTS